MKIKIIRLKVESENQSFDFSEFVEGSNIFFSTNSQLVKEKDGYYWHAFITYEPQIPLLKPFLPKPKDLPEGFEEEVRAYLKSYPFPETRTQTQRTRTQNAVRGGLEIVLKCEKVGDFVKLRNLGKNSIVEEKDFLERLLEIAKKYKANLNTDEDSV